MLGSHDSFTYLDAKSAIINRLTRFWRCQNKTVVEQYNMGVRFFDIRLYRDTVSGKKVWRLAHGLAELSKVYVSVKSICAYFKNTMKGSMIRIWFEKGTDEEWAELQAECTPLLNAYPLLVQVVRKKPEYIWYQSKNFPKTFKNYQYNDWTLKSIMNNLFKFPIKNHAKQVNPVMTLEMIDDPDTLYFMDYVNGVDEENVNETASISKSEQEAIDKLNIE